jgi:hypothetical protein
MSALADRSYATRIAQKRARILAIQYNIARYQNSTTGAIIVPQQGPGGNGVDDSTRAARALGQRRLWREKNPAPCAGAIEGGITVSVDPPSANPLEDGCCSLTAAGGATLVT